MSDIQSLHRAFAILQIISQQPQAARPVSIATQTGLPNTTVLRMLTTLENIGAVVRDVEAGTYGIGTVVYDLAHPKPSHQQLKEAARPYMHQLANQTGETVYLCAEAGEQVYYVDQIDTEHHILLRNWIDIAFPLHTTAAGKVLLAFWEDAKIQAYLARPLEQYTENTIIDPDAICAYVEMIRKNGFAWTHGQTEEGLVGVAAPIWGQSQQIVGALSLGGPAFRFPKAGEAEQVAQQVVETAKQISSQLA
ncbi:MAG: IclR family transcriptional regulator [Chloroflexota bacterium]